MKGNKRLFGVQMEEELITQLRKEARQLGLTLSGYIRFILVRRHNK